MNNKLKICKINYSQYTLRFLTIYLRIKMTWLSIGQYRNSPLPVKPILPNMKRIIWKKPSLLPPLPRIPQPIQSYRWKL